jgi:enoyl-CoA hydratase
VPASVLTGETGAVLVITLNRPHVRNAIDMDTARLLHAALQRLETQPHLRAGVLTGAGGTFCSGMDLKEFTAGRIVVGENAQAEQTRPVNRSKPLVAAVEGWALAGGFELALGCDIVIAAENAKFGLPEVKHGLLASGGGLLKLAAVLPYGKAAALALTGDTIGAQEAHELGLVTSLTPAGGALDEAMSLAGRIAANPAAAVGSTLKLLQFAAFPHSAGYAELEASERSRNFASDEAHTGAAAFATRKNAPDRQG